ncbi:hypothetical protein EMPS_03740 [Entomortierella parvispora]|uniref:MHD domain-containing protein n=1 Tax=Entomortierella parvispora TaxID=205924 RepID=A0A9P3H7E1_9FUNG|nr:hypothetical protein EMPS_03740 [Entomortierella parvispora]
MGFAEAFLTERPQDGLDAVQARLRKGKQLHEQFANYFKERAHIEDMYAKNITKAFQKHFVTDMQALGTFTAPWEKLSAESLELATLHGQFSLRISTEIEKPLRDFTRTHPDWQNLALAETNCNRIAKEFDEKQVKVAKYTKAVERVSGKKADATEQKLMDYTKQLDSTKTAWRLEGPVVLQKYQDVDHGRLEHLKSIVSAFEAMQNETALQIAEMSGRTAGSVAEFDPVMDVELYSSEMSINMHCKGYGFVVESEVVGSSQIDSFFFFFFFFFWLNLALEQPDNKSVVSAASHRSNGDTVGSMDARRTNGAHKRGLTGSSQISNVSYSTDRSFQQSKSGSLEQTRPSDPQEHIRSTSSVLGSALDVPTGSTHSQLDAEGFTIPPSDNSPWSDAGVSSTYDDERSETSSFSQQPKMQMEIRQDSVSESNDEARAALERVASTLKQTKTISRRHPGRREVRSMYQSEDTSSAYNSFHSSPLSTGFTSDTSREPSSSTPPSMNSPGSRVFFNNSASQLQTSGAHTPTLSRASTLGLPASASSPSQPHSSHSIPPPTPPLSNAHIAGTTLAPISILGAGQALAAEPESLTSAPTSPIKAAHTTTAQDHPLGSAPEGANGQKQHWVVSVIEKVHAHTQAGEISKMMVTGEVILTLEGTEIDPALTRTKRALLRLEHLESLEKHVPNPAYLSPVEATAITEEGHAQQGSYWVNLESLAQAMHQHHIAGGGSGVVVLKYQVRTTEEESRQTMIPLLIHPAWKCEAHQTSLLINYKTNAHCKLATRAVDEEESAAGAKPMAMSEVSFLVPVSGDVTNVQSRPTGVWNAESNKMFWDVENLLLKGEHAFEPKKLLARFELNTTGENAGPSQPSATAVKFRIQDQLLSDLTVLLERVNEDENEATGEATTEDQEEKKESSLVAFGSVRLQVQSGRYLALA